MKTSLQHSKALPARLIASKLALAIASLPVASNLAFAQTSCSTSNCSVDLYQGTLDAIAAYGAQPTNNEVPPSTFTPVAITGGTLYSTPMVITTPSGQGTPTEQVLNSLTIYNCPGGPKNLSGTQVITATANSTTSVTSDQTVTTSNSTWNDSSASVSISYEPPGETGGVSGGAEYTYEWGQSKEQDNSNESGNEQSTSVESSFSTTVNFSVPAGYSQTFQYTDSVVTYTGANWTSQVSLSGPITSVAYNQIFRSSIPPDYANIVSPAGYNSNLWNAPKTWKSSSDWNYYDGMASPNGAYYFFPNNNSYFTGLYWAAYNSAPWHFSQGGMNGTGDSNPAQGMILHLDGGTCDPSQCGGTFWASTSDGSKATWISNADPDKLYLQDDGNLMAYQGGNLVWSSGPQPGNTNPLVPSYSWNNPTPSQLLPNNGQAFIASGTFASTTYNSTATVVSGPFVPLTSDQIASWCPGSTTSSTAPSQRDDDGYVYMKASYNPDAQGGAFIMAQNRPNGGDDERGARIERLREEDLQKRRNQAAPAVRQKIQDSTNGQNVVDHKAILKERKDDDRVLDEKRNGVVKLVKIKGPLQLKPNQYYATDLPGYKVKSIVIRSNDLSNYTGFAPGPTTPIDGGTRTPVKMKLGKPKQVYSVKPRETI